MTTQEAPRGGEVPSPHATAFYESIAFVAGESGDPIHTAVQEIKGKQLASLFSQGYLSKVEQDPSSPAHAARLENMLWTGF